MTEIESLQERVDAIRATGDPELAGRAWRALSRELLVFTREKKRARRFPMIKRINAADVERFLSDLSDRK